MKILTDAVGNFLANATDTHLQELRAAFAFWQSKYRRTPRQRLYSTIHAAIEDEGIELNNRLHMSIDKIVQEVERRIDRVQNG